MNNRNSIYRPPSPRPFPGLEGDTVEQYRTSVSERDGTFFLAIFHDHWINNRQGEMIPGTLRQHYLDANDVWHPYQGFDLLVHPFRELPPIPPTGEA